MIRVRRGVEPLELAAKRAQTLPLLRQILAKGHKLGRTDIDGYKLVAQQLWKQQHHKCCYCEKQIGSRNEDVEHYRPAIRADRSPGCTQNDGYWWLALSWENLLFACASCNRFEKNDKFPLSVGDQPLVPEAGPPGAEHPLLLDPAGELNPVAHIEFRWEAGLVGSRGRWWARPRNGSQLGRWTIEVCGMNDHDDYFVARWDHVENFVRSRAEELNEVLSSGSEQEVERRFRKALGLIEPQMPFVGLSYDALRHFVPDPGRRGYQWPAPDAVALPPLRAP